MKIEATHPEAYLEQLPEDRKTVLTQLRQTILAHLPEGFAETMSYGMIGYIVPHSIYPSGYHCNPSQALPFMSIASQKNFVALYHMGLYASEELLQWFQEEYPKHSPRKLSMGKSCVRFKNLAYIPYDLIGELVSKISVEDWIVMYENSLNS